MTRRKRGKMKLVVSLVVTIILLAAMLIGYQFVTKTGLFHIPGVVIYDEGLNEDELNVLGQIFTDEVELDKNVEISARTVTELGELEPNEYLYEISVPVVDYYNVYEDVSDYNEEDIEYIPIGELDFAQKLLSVNGKYYLDEFDTGANFRIVTFESEKFEDEIKPLVDEEFSKEFPSKDTVLTFAQTGVTALSRAMNSKLNAVGDAKYFAESIGDYLSSFDLTHTSNESSFSGSATSDNICSDARFIDTLTAIGLDIVELTGNHNQDCGDESAKNTIDIYNENGIKIVGGGKTADEAKEPLEISEKGNGITFLAYNLSTGGATTDDTPGANQYYEEDAKVRITEAKDRGDFVVVDMQYYECSSYDVTFESTTCDYADSSAGDQIGVFRHLIDLGADLVVGTSAHQPQTFELYGDGVIYYGLGNLFFDQYWWPGTSRSLILAHYFYNDKLLQTRVVPTVYDSNMQPEILDKDSTIWFLERLVSERP